MALPRPGGGRDADEMWSQETPNTAFGARDCFPFLEFFCVPHIRVQRGVGLRIHSISLYVTPPDIHIVHNKQAHGQLDNS